MPSHLPNSMVEQPVLSTGKLQKLLLDCGLGGTPGTAPLNRGSLSTSLALCLGGYTTIPPISLGCATTPGWRGTRAPAQAPDSSHRRGVEPPVVSGSLKQGQLCGVSQHTLLQSTCLLRKYTGRKPCVWKLQKKPIFAINILCLTWTCASFLPDVRKGSQTGRLAVKVGQQCLAGHSPEMAQVPGNPTFSAMLGSCTDSSGPRPAACH